MSSIQVSCTFDTGEPQGSVLLLDSVLVVADHLVSVLQEEYAREVLAWYLAGATEALQLRLAAGADWYHMTWERVQA